MLMKSSLPLFVLSCAFVAAAFPVDNRKNGKSTLETLEDSGLLDNLDADFDDMSGDDLLENILENKEFRHHSHLKHQFQDMGLLRHSEQLHDKLSQISASELLDKMERYKGGRSWQSRKLYSRAPPKAVQKAAPGPQKPVQVQITINQGKGKAAPGPARTWQAPKGVQVKVTQTNTAKRPAPQPKKQDAKQRLVTNNNKKKPAPPPAQKKKPAPKNKGKGQNKVVQKKKGGNNNKKAGPPVNAAVVKGGKGKKSKNAAGRLTPGSMFATAASLKFGAAILGIIGGVWMGML